jgi:Spore Coat Protein U domain
MKKLALIAAFGLTALVSSLGAHAATATGNFNVNLTLNSKCEINNTNTATGAVITDLAMTYTSFQLAAATGSTNFNVRCTNLLPYTVALDSTSVTDAAVNLLYTLTLVPPVGGGTGNGANQNYVINGGITAGQAGTCAVASCTNSASANKQRLLTITY